MSKKAANSAPVLAILHTTARTFELFSEGIALVERSCVSQKINTCSIHLTILFIKKEIQ